MIPHRIPWGKVNSNELRGPRGCAESGRVATATAPPRPQPRRDASRGSAAARPGSGRWPRDPPCRPGKGRRAGRCEPAGSSSASPADLAACAAAQGRRPDAGGPRATPFRPCGWDRRPPRLAAAFRRTDARPRPPNPAFRTTVAVALPWRTRASPSSRVARTTSRPGSSTMRGTKAIDSSVPSSSTRAMRSAARPLPGPANSIPKKMATISGHPKVKNRSPRRRASRRRSFAARARTGCMADDILRAMLRASLRIGSRATGGACPWVP